MTHIDPFSLLQQREQLAIKNKETLALLESALFLLVLDDHYPKVEKIADHPTIL